MSTAAAVLTQARGQLGYHETGNNRNKFSSFWGAPAEPWCADFACWALRQAGALDVSYSAGTIQLWSNYHQVGRSGSVPRVGALAFFRWPGHRDFCQHVGIVEAIRPDGRLICIEGNTSVNTAGSQWNGGGVYRKVRSRSLVVSYGYPKYGAATAATHASVKAGPSKPVYPGKPLTLGSTGPAVVAVQHRLGTTADGKYGPHTAALVAAYQRKQGLQADGVCGQITWHRLVG